MLVAPEVWLYLGGMNIVADKVKQAAGVLEELDIDLWLIFVRETSMQADPMLPMMVGHDCTWQSFFAYTRNGDAIALVGNLDEADFTRAGYFTEVATYTAGVSEDIRTLIERLDPSKIAINYSTSDTGADGLTHGMYLLLQEYLDGTAYQKRLISAEPVCSKLRSRKLPAEVELIATAAKLTTQVWDEVHPQLKVGMTEKEVGALIDATIAKHGGEPSFSTIVNAGDKTDPGHGAPSDARLDPGDLLHVDFGIRLDGYCSDLQRLAYFPRREKSGLPEELKEAFYTVNEIITETAKISRPGVKGCEIDALAREMLRDHGYPEYQHALGHQLGRAVHDGGAVLGPEWERYGVTPRIEIEKSNVFTLELEIMLPGIGCVGLEEDVVVTDNGAEFLCPRQMKLVVL